LANQTSSPTSAVRLLARWAWHRSAPAIRCALDVSALACAGRWVPRAGHSSGVTNATRGREKVLDIAPLRPKPPPPMPRPPPLPNLAWPGSDVQWPARARLTIRSPSRLQARRKPGSGLDGVTAQRTLRHRLHFQSNDIAASQLAVDGEIEHGEFSRPPFNLQLRPD